LAPVSHSDAARRGVDVESAVTLPGSHTPPTIAHVDAIAAITDPVIRNLCITQCYHELSQVMAERLTGANWCTFATWASKQAGQSIRREDLERAVDGLGGVGTARSLVDELTAALRTLGATVGLDRVHGTLWRLADPKAAAVRAGAAVARGNLKVFAEIAREFARFIEAGLIHPTADAHALDAFLAGLRAGEPPDGQAHLRSAFSHYRRALDSADAQESAQWMLLANLEIGFHEQTRLQPEIREALDAAVPNARALTDALLQEFVPGRSLWMRLRMGLRRWFGGTTPLEAAVAGWLAVLSRELRTVLTEHLMVIELPHARRVRLGQDLNAAFPPLLRQLTNPDLIALLRRLDPTADSVARSGTRDWSDLADRIHFIADLFRCFQCDATLFDPPFTADQVAEMKVGRRPAGRL
jgi:hypothetical protein